MDKQIRVLCFGDSNTWGYVPDKGTRYPKDVRWTGRLGETPGLDVIEEGLNGRTTCFSDNIEPFRNGLDYAIPCLMSQFPLDVIVIMLGTNDSKHRYNVSSGEIRYGLEELVTKMQDVCRRNGESPRFLIIAPPPMDVGENAEFDASSEAKVRELEGQYEQMAKDFGFDYLRASDYVKDIGADGVHLTEAGHRDLADAVRDTLAT